MNNNMDRVMTVIAKVTDPRTMTKVEYADFLKELIGELSMMLDTVKDEIADEGDEP